MAGVLKSLLLLLLVLSGTAPHAQEEDSPDFLVTEIQSRLSEHARLEPMVMDASGDVRLLLERRLAEKEREILEAVDALVAELGEQPDHSLRSRCQRPCAA